MGWLARRVFQHLDDLCGAVEDLRGAFSGNAHEDIETVVRSLNHIKSTLPVGHLPGYEEAHSLRAPINSCIGFLRAIPIMASFEGYPVSEKQAQQLDAAAYLAREFMYEFYQLCYRDQFAWFVDVDTDHAPEVGPLFISHLLAWPYLHTRFDRFTLMLPEKQSFPPVLYHPHYIPILWESLLFFVRRHGTQRVLAIRLEPEQQSLAIKITKSDLWMTPVRWLELINPQPERPRTHERLYEIGGSFMPMSWDEGEGQGLILRLPWAVQ